MYTPFDIQTDAEFIRWLELNLQDERKDMIVARVLKGFTSERTIRAAYDEGFRDGKDEAEEEQLSECPECGASL